MPLLPGSWRRRAAAVVLLVAAVGGGLYATRTTVPDLPTVEVTRGDFTEIVETRGDVRPLRSIVVTAPYSAGELQILEIATNGASVKKGDVVARFDALTLRRQVQDKSSELRQTQAEIDQAREQAKITNEQNQTAVTKASYDVERAKLDIGDPEVMSQMETERARLALGDAQSRLREMEAKFKAGQASSAADMRARERKLEKISTDIATAQKGLDSLQVVAPADGTVSIMQNYRAGSMMGPSPEFRQGDRAWAGAQILELPDLTSVHVAARIDESDRGQLKKDQTAVLRVDAIPDREYQAVVADISLLARVDFSSGWPPAKNFDLKLAVTDADARLKPGMSAVARIAVGRIPDQIIVPPAAVFTSAGRTVVYKRTPRAFEEVPVEIVRRARDQVAVKGALTAGDRVSTTQPGADKKDQAKK